MSFNEWLNEIEVYGLRLERLVADLPNTNLQNLVKWLEAAYTVGYEEGKKDGTAQS